MKFTDHRTFSYTIKGLVFCLTSCVVFAAAPAFAQTTTTYTYDSQGRVTSASGTDGSLYNYEYDKVSNITNANTNGASGGGGGGNSPPTCNTAYQTTSSNSASYNGLQSCSDPDGDTLTLISVTDPSGPATATKSGNNINFNNLWFNCSGASTTRTISDGQGHTVTATFQVNVSSSPYCN